MKTLLQSSLLVCLIILLARCDNEEAAPTTVVTTLVTFSFDASLTPPTEAWIIAYDGGGKLLDYGKISGTTPTVLTTTETVGDKIGVTLFQYTLTANGSTYHRVESYMAVAPGEAWVMKPFLGSGPAASPGNKIGEFTVQLLHASASSAFMSDRFGSSGNAGSSNDSYNASGPIYENGKSHYLYVVDPNGTPRYKIFEEPVDKAVYSLDAFDLATFDNVITVTYPQPIKSALLLVSGESSFPANALGYFTYLDNLSEASSLKIGYLNRFSRVSTYLSVKYQNKTYGYSRPQGKPSAIVLPFTTTFSITDKTLASYSSTVSVPFVMRESVWLFIENTGSVYNNNIWTVYSPDPTQKIAELPAELVTKYPKFSMSKLTPSYTEFSTTNMSYADFLNVKFKGGTSTNEETILVRVE